MLGRDWNHSSQQIPEEPQEMSFTPAAAVAWGNGSLSHKAQGWVDQEQTLQFQGGGGVGGQQQLHPGQPIPLNMNAVAPGGFPASLTPGMSNEHRAELA